VLHTCGHGVGRIRVRSLCHGSTYVLTEPAWRTALLHANLVIGLLCDRLKSTVKLVRNTLLRRQIFLCVFLSLLVGAFETAVANGQLSFTSSSPLQSAQTPKAGGTPVATVSSPLPPCPPAGSLLVQPSQPATGHHKVILSWNASLHSVNDTLNAVGYCLYRSKDENAIKEKPTCPQCEQINSKPIAGTSCLDDLVEDSTTYYYVVTAVNAKGDPSTPSNDAPAPIPDGKLTAAGRAGDSSIPICRQASAGK
jgi:hypothetical protein